MKISLTGNPFVDTGLGVIAYLAGRKDIDKLTLQDLVMVHADGKTLARKNSKMKSMIMIFLNSISNNPSISSSKRVELYRVLTTAIMNSIGKENVSERCESCGNEYSLDLDLLVRNTLVPLGLKDGTRYVGRDWFPLAGSMGSDAQALPAASRGPNMCATCLFAVHYLPLGVVLVNGRLAVFQSTSKEFWFELVKEIAKEIDNRVRAGVFDNLGANEGNTSAVRRLINVMRSMKADDLPPETTLFLWLFSNLGTKPDCSIEEIPNSALKFIYYAANNIVGFKEIEALLDRDKKSRPESSLLGCISRGADYSLLYPFRDYEGVSNELFATYQVIVRNVPISRLRTAHKIACHIKSTIGDGKQLQKLRKDIAKERSEQNAVRKIIANMIQQGLLTYDEYFSLFLDQSNLRLTSNYDCWKYIKFYLYKDFVKFPVSLEKRSASETDTLDRKPDYYGRLRYVAARVFQMFIEEKGRDKIPNLISSIGRKEAGPAWLQMEFIRLADKHEGFTYSDWIELCTLENGKDVSWEVLAQLRLMWMEWARNGVVPRTAAPTKRIDATEVTALDGSAKIQFDEYEQLVSKIVEYYLQKYGEEKLRKYVFEGLRRKNLGLYWFREQLWKIDSNFRDDNYWENFLQDPDGKSIPLTRLFQLHLSMRNVLRQHTFKDLHH